MTASSVAREIEFWFEFGSAYSYLSIMRIEDEANKRDVKILWKPFLLGPVFQAVGSKGNPFVDQKEKRAYIIRDMERQCQKYGLRWKLPSPFPRSGVLPVRLALLGVAQPWMGAFCRRVMEMNYGLDVDITKAENLAPVLSGLGLPAESLLDQAASEPIKAQLREQTERALLKGIFGAPTTFVSNEMFWGNDRLDEALQLASKR